MLGHDPVHEIEELDAPAAAGAPEQLHLGNDLALEPLVAALLRRRQQIVAQLIGDILFLQLAQPLVGVGDVVEGFDHLGLELLLDGGKRERVFHVVVVELAFGLAVLIITRAFRRRLNGVAVAGAEGGVGICARAGCPFDTAPGCGTTGWPSGPMTCMGAFFASRAPRGSLPGR